MVGAAEDNPQEAIWLSNQPVDINDQTISLGNENLRGRRTFPYIPFPPFGDATSVTI